MNARHHRHRHRRHSMKTKQMNKTKNKTAAATSVWFCGKNTATQNDKYHTNHFQAICSIVCKKEESEEKKNNANPKWAKQNEGIHITTTDLEYDKSIFFSVRLHLD